MVTVNQHSLRIAMSKIKFEQAINDLESLTKKLESGQLSLEESLKVFENGIQLSQQCQKALNNAEQTVVKLSKSETVNESPD
jgi:exodeoxyribonuclease VII small subunit